MSAAYRILVCCCLSYVISQFYRSANAVIGPDLMRELHLTPDDLGILTGAFFVTFAISQVPVGIALDRWGPRRTILITMAIAFLGALWFAVGDGLWELTMARVVLGFGCGALLTGPLVLFGRWFPPDRFATFSGTLIAFGSLGVIASTAPLAWFSQAFGWRNAFHVTAALTVVLFAIAWFTLRDYPPGKEPAHHDGQRESLADAIRGLGAVVRNRHFPYLFVIIFNAYATFITLLGLWSGPYLNNVHGLDTTARGNVLIYMAIGSAIGYFAWGPLDRVFNTRKWLIAVGAGSQLLCFSIIILVPGLNVWLVAAIFTLMALLNGSSVMIFAHARSVFPPELAGRGITTLNIGTMGGAAFQQILTGYLMAWLTPAGAEPSETAYRIVFGVQAALLATALAFYLRVPDAKPNAVQPS